MHLLSHLDPCGRAPATAYRIFPSRVDQCLQSPLGLVLWKSEIWLTDMSKPTFVRTPIEHTRKTTLMPLRLGDVAHTSCSLQTS